MRIFFFSTLLMFVITSNGQSIKNTNINKASVVNIYGNGNVVIGNAIIQQSLETKVFLISSSQFKDTNNNYITILTFGNNEKIPLFGVDMKFKFSSPVLSINGGGTGSMIMNSLSNDYRQYSYSAQQINRLPMSKEAMSFTILSKEKIQFSIYGIDGVMTN